MKEWMLSGVIYVAHSVPMEIRIFVFLFTRNLPELRYWRVEYSGHPSFAMHAEWVTASLTVWGERGRMADSNPI